MRCKDMADARRQAQANADWTKDTWCVFTDTSGNACAERVEGRPPATMAREDREWFYPGGQAGASWKAMEDFISGAM